MKFMKKPTKTEPQPQQTAAETAAEKAIARGKRIEALSTEAAMWRSFADGCVPGRWLAENWNYDAENYRLCLHMDEDTAPMWVAFANQMAEERERRLRDILGV